MTRIVKKQKTDKLPSMITDIEYKKRRGENLKRIREERGYSRVQLAKLIGTNANYITQLEKVYKGRGIGQDILLRLCRALEIDSSELDKPIGGVVTAPPGEIVVLPVPFPDDTATCFECSIPELRYDYWYMKRPYDVTDENAYAVQITGRSMSPRYDPGEIVIASPAVEVQNGDYVVVNLKSGQILIKRIKFRKDGIILDNINPSCMAWSVQAEDVNSYHKIVWKKER